MASVEENSNLTKLQRKKVLSTLNSTDALALIEHGSDLTLSMQTPVGTKFVCHTNLVGIHSHNYIVTHMPLASTQDLEYYFQVGFWSNIRAISPRGEGAIVVFRSQLLHLIKDPVPMALFSIPTSMQVTQLRKEPRFEVNLLGKALMDSSKIDCEIRDISRNGCRFVTSPLCKPYQIDDFVSLRLHIANEENLDLGDLEGRVCNIQRSTHYARYGLEFTETGRVNAGNLLNKLKFTGTKLTLNTSKRK